MQLAAVDPDTAGNQADEAGGITGDKWIVGNRILGKRGFAYKIVNFKVIPYGRCS